MVSLLNSGGNLVQRSETVSESLVEGHSMRIPVKLFKNPSVSFGKDIV